MVRDYIIQIGQRERKLRYTSSDAKTIYREFGKQIKDFLFEDVMGLRPDGKGGYTGGTVTGIAGNPIAQSRFLFLGLQRAGWAQLTEPMLDDYITQSVGMDPPHPQDHCRFDGWLMTAARAACYQGIVFGYSLDLDKLLKAEPEEPEGNAPEPTAEAPG